MPTKAKPIISIDDAVNELTNKVKVRTIQGAKISVYITDPLLGTTAIHGITGSRPKAYAGEHISCPWDNPQNIIIRKGFSYLTINDFPAYTQGGLYDKSKHLRIEGLYEVRFARGENLIVIYSDKHYSNWLCLSEEEKDNVVDLWVESTKRAQMTKNCRFTQIFENDGPTNTMHHPHGQQYNLSEIPPAVKDELSRCKRYYKKTRKNLLRQIFLIEENFSKRIVCRNDSFVAFCPPGSRWPYQVRILSKRHVIWLTELNDKEKKDLHRIITEVRLAYRKLFNQEYKPTIMINIFQAPFDRQINLYRKIYGLRVEFFNTALSPKAERMMFSIENSTGLIPYSGNAENSASQLKSALYPK